MRFFAALTMTEMDDFKMEPAEDRKRLRLREPAVTRRIRGGLRVPDQLASSRE